MALYNRKTKCDVFIFDIDYHGASHRPFGTDNFTIREFSCSDGNPVVLLHPALVRGLEDLRAYARSNVDQRAVVRVNSAWRTPSHNHRIGGKSESRHLTGLAADVDVMFMSPDLVAAWAERKSFGGVGRYRTFTHLDVEGFQRRWDNR